MSDLKVRINVKIVDGNATISEENCTKICEIARDNGFDGIEIIGFGKVGNFVNRNDGTMLVIKHDPRGWETLFEPELL